MLFIVLLIGNAFATLKISSMSGQTMEFSPNEDTKVIDALKAISQEFHVEVDDVILLEGKKRFEIDDLLPNEGHLSFFVSPAIKVGNLKLQGGRVIGAKRNASPKLQDGVSELFINGWEQQYVALKHDKTAICWDEIWEDNGVKIVDDVVKVLPGDRAFGFLKSDGSVDGCGFEYQNEQSPNGAIVPEDLKVFNLNREGNMKVIDIFATSMAFAALMEDGSLRAWGKWYGGNDDKAQAGGSGFTSVEGGKGGFRANKENGESYSWGLHPPQA